MNTMLHDSKFDGKLHQYVGHLLLGCLIIVITLGLGYPWVLCRAYRWKIKHTVIEGRRLAFDGTAMELFGNWIKWFLLCIITLGIYSFWLKIKLEAWKVKHTYFCEKQ